MVEAQKGASVRGVLAAVNFFAAKAPPPRLSAEGSALMQAREIKAGGRIVQLADVKAIAFSVEKCKGTVRKWLERAALYKHVNMRKKAKTQ